MPDLSPSDVERLLAADRKFVAELRDKERAYESTEEQVQLFEDWQRRQQQNIYRVTAAENLRIYMDAYADLEARYREVKAGFERLRTAAIIAVLILVPLAIAGWGR